MNRIELIIATAIVLFIAFLIGWFAHWLMHRFVRLGNSDMTDLDTMAQQLHDAEEKRDEAVAYYQNREAEVSNQLSQTEAELRAAMEGLRDARHEAEELRGWIERQHAQ